MGLGFSHSNVGFSYSGFNDFRRLVAKAQGMELFSFGGYEHRAQKEGIKVTRSLHELRGEPLYALFNHSDCDDALTPEECALIGPVLLAICEAWPEDDRTKAESYFRREGIEWAKDLIEHGKENRTMYFQ